MLVQHVGKRSSLVVERQQHLEQIDWCRDQARLQPEAASQDKVFRSPFAEDRIVLLLVGAVKGIQQRRVECLYDWIIQVGEELVQAKFQLAAGIEQVVGQGVQVVFRAKHDDQVRRLAPVPH